MREASSSLEQITEEVAATLGRFSFHSEARFLEGMLSALRASSGSPEGQEAVARDILSAYRGMGSLNDVVIMVDGRADVEANGRVVKLLRRLRAVAVEVATGSDG